MGDALEVNGFVLSSMAIGEADRRVVLLTRELGRISAFARGARKPTSPYVSGTRMFAFGKFSLYQGRNSYSLQGIEIRDYFEPLVTDVEAAAYGCYFSELTSYFTRENIDCKNILNLLYVTFRALEKKKIPYKLIRRIFELRTLVYQGEYPDFFSCRDCKAAPEQAYFDINITGITCTKCHIGQGGVLLDEASLYTLQFIAAQPLNELYTFSVSETVMEILDEVIGQLMTKYVDRHLLSIDVLEALI